MIAGGAEIFEQCLPLATHMILTEIPGEYLGDTFFPEFNANQWHEERVEEYEGFKVRWLSRVPGRPSS